MNEKKKIYFINIIFLGESGVGKSSIINRLLGLEFNMNIPTTVSSPILHLFKNYKILNEEEDDSEISIRIWDTAGQEKFQSLCTNYVKKADIIVFVRDNQQEKFEIWFKFVENIIDIRSKKIFYLLNKTDLISDKEKYKIYHELHELNRKNKHNAIVQLVSSKSSEGIFNLKSLIDDKSQEIIKNELKKHNYKINIIVCGNSYVGKSCLIERIINNNFDENKFTATSHFTTKSKFKYDFKNNFSIIYTYYDTSGEKKQFELWSNILEKVDIIIFVNDKDDLRLNFLSIIKEKIVLSDKKVIFCINKNDLFSGVEKAQIIKNFEEINFKDLKLKDKPLFLVSAKTSDGIENLIKKINEYSNEIIEEKKNKLENQNTEILNLRNSFVLEPKTEKKCLCYNFFV